MSRGHPLTTRRDRSAKGAIMMTLLMLTMGIAAISAEGNWYAVPGDFNDDKTYDDTSGAYYTHTQNYARGVSASYVDNPDGTSEITTSYGRLAFIGANGSTEGLILSLIHI